MRTPTRRRSLIALGPHGLFWLARFLGRIVPRASRELSLIRSAAGAIPDAALRAQALASIADKAYHVQGGSIFATFLPPAAARRYIAIAAPLETIYDYLDNLCDRLPDVAPAAYPTLHEALLDALDDRRPIGDYYRDGPRRDDGGYLAELVQRVRGSTARLPQYLAVRDKLAEFGALYAELQTFKHAAAATREALCRDWYARNADRFPGLFWWEFAAACGSSLPIFALLLLAAQPVLTPAAVERTAAAYFPHVSAVHILLDYFIDQAEDREHGELNFVACYASRGVAVERIGRLVAAAVERVRTLHDGEAHGFVVHVMCLFYLTHPKVFEQRLGAAGTAILAAIG